MRSGQFFVLGILCLLGLANDARGQGAQATGGEILTKENIVDTAHATESWVPAEIAQQLREGDRLRTGALSRATMRLTDLSVLRVNELTTLRILPPESSTRTGFDLRQGLLYFFSREKPQSLRIRTPVVTGALRGTEFHLAVAPSGKTVLTMFDGEVELRNALGRIVVTSGEQGTVELGRAPYKTAVIEARNIIQWCLYYPGVIDLAELKFTPAEEKALAVSLDAYGKGDLLGALRTYPHGHGTSDAELVYRAALWLVVG